MEVKGRWALEDRVSHCGTWSCRFSSLVPRHHVASVVSRQTLFSVLCIEAMEPLVPATVPLLTGEGEIRRLETTHYLTHSPVGHRLYARFTRAAKDCRSEAPPDGTMLHAVVVLRLRWSWRLAFAECIALMDAFWCDFVPLAGRRQQCCWRHTRSMCDVGRMPIWFRMLGASIAGVPPSCIWRLCGRCGGYGGTRWDGRRNHRPITGT
ncbi:hypothetical protein TcBrA4_0040590 [Trypanosoma cruzi]|nr:hypothetical protein TcBrA4_0040590 [Trypanosoma cruzi]